MTALGSLRLLVYTDSGSVGGAELVLGYLLGALAPEIEIGVLTTDEHVAEALGAHRGGMAIATVRNPRGAGDFGALREHVRAVRAFSPHVLHVNHAWPWACAYGELAGILGPRMGVVVIDHLPARAAVTRARRLSRQFLARRASAHVSVGERAAREVEELVGLRHGSVGSIPNGVPIERGLTARTSKSEVVIGSLGRLTEQKRYDLLVRALPGLPGAKLVLVGDGPEREALEALAEELGVGERLVVTGWVQDARSHLGGFDVFALPSGWEGMPLGILEAMHSGLPVLASDVGSVGEVVIDGETGYLVASGDLDGIRERLARLLGDPEACLRMGERGRVRALERYTDTIMAARYEALYREVLNGQAGEARKFQIGSSKVSMNRSRE